MTTKNKYPEATPYPCNAKGFEKAGFKVDIEHRRYGKIVGGLVKYETSTLSPRGGETFATITDQDGNKFKGEAVCSFYDNFNKKVGVTKSLGRAFSQYLKQTYPGIRK